VPIRTGGTAPLGRAAEALPPPGSALAPLGRAVEAPLVRAMEASPPAGPAAAQLVVEAAPEATGPTDLFLFELLHTPAIHQSQLSRVSRSFQADGGALTYQSRSGVGASLSSSAPGLASAGYGGRHTAGCALGPARSSRTIGTHLGATGADGLPLE